MSRLATAIGRLDGVKITVLLWINAAPAAFVLVAHGGALLLYRLGKAPEVADEVFTLYWSIPGAILGLLLSLVGLGAPSTRTIVLKIQAVLLLLLAIGMVYFAIDVIAFGIAPEIKFAWNPVLFAFVVAYPVYVARRAFASAGTISSDALLFAPVWAAAISVVVSLLVFWRVWGAAT